MDINFPPLTKDDIEVRIGQVSKSDPNKASLLLYQDARCGMKYLDQVVGPMNWQKRYYESKGLLICAISIYDKEKGEWVEKSDTGSAGNIEEEKSLASDSFKRCCVCWGLARELYTAPDIWVKFKDKYDKFFVREIAYNKEREISKLVIVNGEGVVAYSYPKNATISQPLPTQDKSIQSKPREIIRLADLTFIKNWLLTAPDNMVERFEKWLAAQFEVKSADYLTIEQGEVVVRTLKEKYNA